MNASGWIQLVRFVAALAAITKPMGLYLLRVLEPDGRTWLDPVVRPLERLTYRLLGVDPKAGGRGEGGETGTGDAADGEGPGTGRGTAIASTKSTTARA
jgi:hypothetical protein